MEKTIDIGGKSIRLVSNGITPVLYRQKFKRDLFAVMNEVGTASAKGEIPDTLPLMQAAYIMAKQGDPEITDDWMEWFSQFEMMDTIMMMPQIVTLWGQNSETLARSKKKSGRRSAQ